MQIGFIGLGIMGRAIAENLLKAGHQVTVWNRSPGPVAALAAKGAVAAKSAEDTLGGEVLFSMLASDAVMRAVGLDGALLAKAAKGLVHANLATISTGFAQELAKGHAAHGLGYVSAPVFGRPDAAAAAQLEVVAAGGKASLDKVMPLFAQIGRRVEIVGDRPEQANLFKISGNFLIASALESMSEVFTMLAKGGVDPAKFHEILTDGLFSGRIYKNYGRLVIEKKFTPPGFALALGLKDVRLAEDAAKTLGMNLPIGTVVRGHLEQAIDAGFGEEDWTAVSKVIARNAAG